MFENLQVFRMASAMAVHAGKRQALVAANMANADTPGYQPRDLPPFSQSMPGDAGTPLRATRAGHVDAGATSAVQAQAQIQRGEDPNGNGVSVEQEMLRAVEIKRQHDRALTIYKSSLGILRSALGRP